jgi:hypothetical protein
VSDKQHATYLRHLHRRLKPGFRGSFAALRPEQHSTEAQNNSEKKIMKGKVRERSSGREGWEAPRTWRMAANATATAVARRPIASTWDIDGPKMSAHKKIKIEGNNNKPLNKHQKNHLSLFVL